MRAGSPASGSGSAPRRWGGQGSPHGHPGRAGSEGQRRQQRFVLALLIPAAEENGINRAGKEEGRG